MEQDVSARLPKVSVAQGDDNISITGRLNRLFARAEDEAKRLKDQYVSVEHFLLALIEDTGTSGRLLKEFGVTARTGCKRHCKKSAATKRVTTQNPEATYEALEKYGRDLTKLASQGKVDPVIGRDEEIRRVIQVLSRRTKNNPVLIGEPGVGKTAIVEGLAQRIVRWRRCPRTEKTPHHCSRHGVRNSSLPGPSLRGEDSKTPPQSGFERSAGSPGRYHTVYR